MMPGAHGPDAHRVRRLVAAAGDHRRAGAKPGGRGCRGADHAGDRRAPRRRRQPARDRSRARRRPPATSPRGEVEEQRAGAIGLVHGVVAGQPQPDVVLRAAARARPAPTCPARGRGPRRSFGAVKPVSASLPVTSISRSGPTSRADLVALGARALVVPQDRRPQHLRRPRRAGRAPCICPVSPTATTSSPATPAAGSADADRRHRPVPPQARVLLAPQRPRDVVRVLGGADADDRPRPRR